MSNAAATLDALVKAGPYELALELTNLQREANKQRAGYSQAVELLALAIERLQN